MIVAISLGDRAKWRDQLYRADISPSAKAVGAYISDRIQQETGKGVAKMRTIAAALRISLSTTKRTIKEMVRAGLLVVESGVGWRANRYQCVLDHSGSISDPSVGPPATPPCNPGIDTKDSPLPPEGKVSIELNLEIAPEQPSVVAELQIEDNTLVEPETAPSAALSEPETTPEQVPAPIALQEAENAVEAQPEAASEPAAPEVTEQDVIQAIIVHFINTTGTRCDQARHRKAIKRALRANSAEEIKRAATHCANSWSNRTWATPAAVCKPGRVDEVLSQMEATAAPQAAAHQLFSAPKLRLPREYVEQHRQSGEELGAADARLLFEIRTGRRRPPQYDRSPLAGHDAGGLSIQSSW